MAILETFEFSAHAEELMREHHVPGISIAIVRNDAIATLALGKSSIQPPIQCTPDTLFDIASSSKSLTAASVAQLVDDNEKYPEVQWDTPVSRLLPQDFVIQGNEGHTELVTVEDMLSHRTGMAPHDDSYLNIHAVHPDNAHSMTRNLRNLPVGAPVRSKYMYCNMMFTVASYLVEKKTGIPFPDYLEQHFFKPLNMASSNLQPSKARAKGLGQRIATAYAWDKDLGDEGEYRAFQSPVSPEGQGAGSIVTSVNDYILYVQAMLKHNTPPVTEEMYQGLIRPRIVSELEASNNLPYSAPTLVAAGWEVSYYRGHMLVRHAGCIAGFGSTHFFMPAFDFGGAIFGNANDAIIVVETLMWELVDDVLDVPKHERPDWNKIISERMAAEDDTDEERLQQEMCPGLLQPEPQTRPLTHYTGSYVNAGYHTLTVQINHGKLFIDAKDRGSSFELTLVHVSDQRKYIAQSRHVDDNYRCFFKAEFEFDGEGARAVRLGVDFEEQLDSLIWFQLEDAEAPQEQYGAEDVLEGL